MYHDWDITLLWENGQDENFLDKSYLMFTHTRNMLDAKMKQLPGQGVGVKKRKVEAIAPRKEDVLWTTGQLRLMMSCSLLNTVFYYNCKLFGLRGMDEHHKLQCEQFNTGQDKEGIFVEFVDRFSKSLNGGLNTTEIEQ